MLGQKRSGMESPPESWDGVAGQSQGRVNAGEPVIHKESSTLVSGMQLWMKNVTPVSLGPQAVPVTFTCSLDNTIAVPPGARWGNSSESPPLFFVSQMLPVESSTRTVLLSTVAMALVSKLSVGPPIFFQLAPPSVERSTALPLEGTVLT